MKPTGNPHAMPMPTNIPWRSESMPWSMTAAMQNGVMQFSAPNLMPEPFFRRTINLHKRKSEIVPPLPNKQHITEEKITAHFSGMHISSNYTPHSSNQDDDDDTECDSNPHSMEYDFNNPITQKELEMKLKNANRITICDEIKKIHAAHSNFMPNALINRVERPCTALVLWQPPAKLEDLVTGQVKTRSNSSIEFDDDDQNNNSIDRPMSSEDASSTDGMDTDL